MQSTVELAAMAPGTMLCDYSLYVCTFLAIAGAPAVLCGVTWEPGEQSPELTGV